MPSGCRGLIVAIITAMQLVPTNLLRTSLAVVGLALLPALAACEDTRRAVGLGVRDAPDEFAVVQNDPLVVPQGLEQESALPAPRAANPNLPLLSDAVDDAERALFGTPLVASNSASDEPAPLSAIEKFLLDGAGAGAGNRDIRTILANEAPDTSETLGERILFWQERTTGPVLDPEAERARIDALQESGEPVNGDGVPVLLDEQNNLF